MPARRRAASARQLLDKACAGRVGSSWGAADITSRRAAMWTGAVGRRETRFRLVLAAVRGVAPWVHISTRVRA